MASNNQFAVDPSLLSAILKKAIAPRIQELAFKKTMLLDKIPQNQGVKFENDKIYVTGTYSRHSGVAFTGPTGGIRVGRDRKVQMVSEAKFGYGSHIIWDSSLQVTNSQGGAIVEISKNLGQELEDSFRFHVNRMLYGNGEGVLTLIPTGAASTATHTVSSTFFLDEGMQVLVGTKAQVEAGTADATTIASVNSDTSVTFADAITTANGDRIVIAGIYDATNSKYFEIDGLSKLVSNNTESAGSYLQGVLRSSNVAMNSYVESSSATLLESHLIDLITQASKFGKPQFMMTTPELKNRYGSLLQQQRRYVGEAKLDGGYMGLEVAIGDKPVALVSDFSAPTGTVFAITPESLSLAQLAPMGFLPAAGGGVLTDVYDADGNRLPAYQTTMRMYGNLVVLNPRANAKLTNKAAS